MESYWPMQRPNGGESRDKTADMDATCHLCSYLYTYTQSRSFFLFKIYLYFNCIRVWERVKVSLDPTGAAVTGGREAPQCGCWELCTLARARVACSLNHWSRVTQAFVTTEPSLQPPDSILSERTSQFVSCFQVGLVFGDLVFQICS